MNDYYSTFSQPSVDVRARNLVDVVLREQKFREHFTFDELKKFALDIAEASNEYSMTGYNVFGFAAERKLLYSVLESKMKDFNGTSA